MHLTAFKTSQRMILHEIFQTFEFKPLFQVQYNPTLHIHVYELDTLSKVKQTSTTCKPPFSHPYGNTRG